ncbi:CRISPR-associated endonuclease Cas3'' [Methylotuvimicrobium buryatense]|uniref:CRISPR-associated endonuclease Cas3 n=1 Tax=Methylotuvimicrobium buryatense TaxID=95641 RepID=A0A4P9UPF7_METBY|nr:CRISPR-associated endonuclease Cas3'' [Methylotuvimicrobium buryatense]QCW83238.1 CRISPR-associated endonuclease Cas3'' [Methylotuvimicrobium buryatense]
MMVTFICECEKKALNRTRRVLDAFANRIGSRTWQTVITEEGLQAVKKLLRKSATKNTAVACHWIRSRSRSELQWVVGNQYKFNDQGIVPVNYTNQLNVLKMDELDVNIEEYFANTKKQPLAQHLFAVGYVAYKLCLQLTNNETMAKTAFITGCWHDMGKVDDVFADWLIKELKKKGILNQEVPESGQHVDSKAKNYPRHNEISLLLFYLLNKQTFANSQSKKYTEHAIYWHHDKWFRGVEKNGDYISFSLDMVYNKMIEKVGVDKFNTLLQLVRTLTQQINIIAENYSEDDNLLINHANSNIDEDKLAEIEDAHLPKYKKYTTKLNVEAYQDNILENAKCNIVRTVVVTADRLVSSLSADQLTAHLEEQTLDAVAETALLNDRGLTVAISHCLEQFNIKYPDSDRNKQQTQAALELSDDEVMIGVLKGPAGCGKTKIALEWAVNTYARKIIWVCPRVQVCQGMLTDLTSKEYLPETKIEICTGEFKTLYQYGKSITTPDNQEFSGDIVITTIDQILNTITTHRKVTGLVQYMNAHVVFDEYHEYINMPGFNLLFAELVACKRLQERKNNCLLVSATPNPYFVKELLGLNQDDMVGIESFNRSQYKIEFVPPFDEGDEANNPLYQTQPDNTFIISNTAITAQRGFIRNQAKEKALLFHSKYKKLDKEVLFKKVFETFKYRGTKDYAVLRAGPIVQASLNISCDRMMTEITHAENWLQRLGRLDRFGENSDPNVYITAVPESLANGKQSGACARFLNQSNCLQSTKAWHSFLVDKITEKPIMSIAEIYQIYQDFYDDPVVQKAVEQDMLAALKKSVDLINAKIMDPVAFPNKNKTKVDKPKIKKNSLRGENRFVQMAVWNIGNGKEEFPNEYAYDEADTQGHLTLEVKTICGNDDSEKDLLAFMTKKHHNINDNAEKYGVTDRTKYKDKIYLSSSKVSETPIYLSYIPADLKQLETRPHPYAIYYAVGKFQPIGALSRDQITTFNELALE